MQRACQVLIVASLFTVFSAIYLLTYSGNFHSTDEMAMFAVTENIVKHGQFNSDQIRWQTPFLWAALLGLPLWIRKHPAEAWFGASICVPYILLYATWFT